MIKYFPLFILLSLPHFAQQANYEIGGYGKYLFSTADNPVFGRVNDNLFHARLNGKWFIANNLTAGLEIRNRFFYGESVEKTPQYLSTIRSRYDISNTDVVWWNAKTSLGYSELDRFWIDAVHGRFQITIGRQRIAFGTALVWNPIDLFNPLSILDFDYEERPGVDAVRLQYFNSEVSKIEIAIKPGNNSSNSVIATKILLNAWEYDFHIIGGMRGRNPSAGIAWSGNISGAGFRGEFLTSKIDDDAVLLFPHLKNRWSSSYTLSADYMFPNTFYIHTEVLYNDKGVTGNASLSLPRMQSLNLLSASRWSLFQELSFEIHPLVHLSGFILYNPNDASSAMVPSATWSALENFDISFFGLFFSGGSTDEYGNYGTSLFIRAKYSF